MLKYKNFKGFIKILAITKIAIYKNKQILIYF